MIVHASKRTYGSPRILPTLKGMKLPIVGNLLDCSFNPVAPNVAWAGDITYVRTSEGWLYLAVVMEIYSRRIVGWSMDSRMTRTLVIDAMKMALEGQIPDYHTGNSFSNSSADIFSIPSKVIIGFTKSRRTWTDLTWGNFFFRYFKCEEVDLSDNFTSQNNIG